MLHYGLEFVLTYMFCSFPLFPRKCNNTQFCVHFIMQSFDAM